jgi:hypothetical protein
MASKETPAIRPTRRSLLATSGSATVLTAGCLDGRNGGVTTRTTDAEVETRERTLGSKGLANVVVWRDDDGTTYADAHGETIDSGTDAGAVLQSAHDFLADQIRSEELNPYGVDSGGRIYLSEDAYHFDTPLRITTSHVSLRSDGAVLIPRSELSHIIRVGDDQHYPRFTNVSGLRFDGRFNADTAIKVEGFMRGSIRDCYAQDFRRHFIHSVANSGTTGNNHLSTFHDIWTFRIPLPLKFESDKKRGVGSRHSPSVSADNAIFDCYFGLGDLPNYLDDPDVDGGYGGILLRDSNKNKVERIWAGTHNDVEWSTVKVESSGLKQNGCVGNVLKTIHAETGQSDPGPVVDLVAGEDFRAGLINNTIVRDTYQTPFDAGPLVRIRSKGRGRVRNTLIDGFASDMSSGSTIVDIGAAGVGTRIRGLNVYRSNAGNNIRDEGTNTIINGVSQQAAQQLALPEGRFYAGDVVYNPRDTAAYRKTPDGSWIQETPTKRLDLSQHDGAFDGQYALDDGSNTPGNGTLCIWDVDADGWQPTSGGTVF